MSFGVNPASDEPKHVRRPKEAWHVLLWLRWVVVVSKAAVSNGVSTGQVCYNTCEPVCVRGCAWDWALGTRAYLHTGYKHCRFDPPPPLYKLRPCPSYIIIVYVILIAYEM